MRACVYAEGSVSAWLWGLQSGSWGPRPCRASSRARAEAAEQTPAWPGLGGDEGCGVSDRGSSGSKELLPAPYSVSASGRV